MVLNQPLAMPGGRALIKEGDLVIVYESFTSIKSVYIDSKATYASRYGSFPHKDWIGTEYGSKVFSRPPGCGWVHLLAPTPELWTLVLRHRTQILYVADIAAVVAGLDLRPGRVVLESGTGSGSLTHSLARAVAPTGRVRTFEFHELRAADAAAEFKRNGLPESLVTVTLRNIEELGFPEPELVGAADGVFLDLPGPWKVVPSAARCLKPNGRFCGFSPCIEQVQRTCEALDAAGFTDITTIEVLLRSYEVAREDLLPPLPVDGGGGRGGRGGNAGAAAAAAAAAATAAAAAAAAQNGSGSEAGGNAASTRKRGRDDDDDGGDGGDDSGNGGAAADDADAAMADAALQEQQQQPSQQQQQPSQQQSQPQQQPPAAAATDAQPRRVPMVVARPSMDARGHTGYLTFARKFV